MKEFLDLKGLNDLLSNLKELFSLKNHSHTSSDITDISNTLEQTHANAIASEASAIRSEDAAKKAEALVDFTIDEDLSETSANPVQNKVITKSVNTLIAHIDDKQNPHGVTLAQLGAASANSLSAHIQNKSNPHDVTKAQVGLGNCDNTADNVKSVKNADTVDGKHFSDIQSDAQGRANARLALSGGTMSGNIDLNNNLINNIRILRATSSNPLYLQSENSVQVTNSAASTNMDLRCAYLRCISVVNDSFREAKENISLATEDRIKKILDIPIETFDYRPGFSGGKKNVLGMIVDEVQDVIPEAVYIPDGWNESQFDELLGSMGNGNIPSIEKDVFIPYLIGMVQLQQKMIDSLDCRIKTLEKEKG